MAIVVRRAEESDLPALREIQPNPDAELVDKYFEAQKAGTLIFAVAFDGAEPVGTALLDFDADGMTPELRNMYVPQKFRRRGAGRALSRWIEDQARAAGHTAVYLAVDPNNEKAVPLYVSLEYHPTGEHRFVENPDIPQVADESEASQYYAIYKKSLTAR
ncbi:GNAT family N-acetyltransferase [Tessaracoccus sp. OS52]|uniref:GNAT family N-acetyltransferase n=1 Tax=Tessaracoccus sp. OS52 TaxID=2886691 RepID=UPI001D101184|nr:GNAT family N-acetyltransferase [Tessaracoccus sp. OS52]MCC2593276.1 GNAT family N-acetyltransferase [Tessaracoccus sp. OS52]